MYSLLLGALLVGAPVPTQVKCKPFPDPIFNVTGQWQMLWGSTWDKAWFYPNHTYRQEFSGNVYIGVWKVLPCGELEVEECILGSTNTYFWRVKLHITKGGFRGTIKNSDTKWGLSCQDP